MNARTAVQPEPVLRLASLLWRRRRATVIETDLLRIQSELLRQQTPAKTTSVPISPRIVDNAMQPFLRALRLQSKRMAAPPDRRQYISHGS